MIRTTIDTDLIIDFVLPGQDGIQYNANNYITVVQIVLRLVHNVSKRATRRILRVKSVLKILRLDYSVDVY